MSLLESIAHKLPPDFNKRLISASRKSGKAPEEVITDALDLYKATLLRPGSKERLRVYVAQYYSLIGKETFEKMTAEEIAARASLGGKALAKQMSTEEKRARARKGGKAGWAKLSPEQKLARVRAAVEARRQKRIDREQELSTYSEISKGKKKPTRS